MSSFARYYCTYCYNVWDQHTHKPKLLKCGHTFCEKCINRLYSNTQIICPDDMQVTQLKSINELQTSFELLNPQSNSSVIQSTADQDQFPTTVSTLCPHHQLKQDQYCHDDNKFICIKCANDPKHRNHNIKNISGLKYNYQYLTSNQLSNIKQSLLENQKNLKEKHQLFELHQQTYFNEIYRVIIAQKKHVSDQIQQQFQEVLFKIRNTEQLLLQQLNIIAIKLEDQMRQQQLLNDQHKHQNYQNVQSKISNLLIQSNDGIGKVFDQINTLQVQSNQVIKDLETNDKTSLIEYVTKCLQITFNTEFIDQIPYFARFTETPELTIDAVNTSRQSYANKHSQRIIRQVKPNANQLNVPQSARNNTQIQQYSKNAQHFETEQSVSQERQIIRTYTFGRLSDDHQYKSADKRSNSACKLLDSRIFIRVEELLQSGQGIEKLDLTNQNMNDTDIIEVVSQLRESNSKVEILKLAKNRIKDLGLSHVIQCFLFKPDLHTINLSNNLCTDKSIDIIMRLKKHLNGKTIYLSNCKLNAAKLKSKQQQLIECGVNLFL